MTLAEALETMRDRRSHFHLPYVTIESTNGDLLVMPRAAWETGRGTMPGDRLVCTLLLEEWTAVQYTDRGWELYYQQSEEDDDE